MIGARVPHPLIRHDDRLVREHPQVTDLVPVQALVAEKSNILIFKLISPPRVAAAQLLPQLPPKFRVPLPPLV